MSACMSTAPPPDSRTGGCMVTEVTETETGPDRLFLTQVWVLCWVLHWVLLGVSVAKPLTEARIAKLKHDPGGSTVQIHYDTAHPGLGVRLYASGAQS